MIIWGLSELLQIAEKRREVKGNGEKERYKHLNAEFQRIARGDKKAFLSDKRWKQQNGKTRDLLKKIRDTFHAREWNARYISIKGTFHAKMG